VDGGESCPEAPGRVSGAGDGTKGNERPPLRHDPCHPMMVPRESAGTRSVSASMEDVIVGAQNPADSRGTIIGWQGSCLNGGTALAAPLIGAIMDATGWQWGFLVAGIAGAVIGGSAHRWRT
jgi:hypothetical protein